MAQAPRNGRDGIDRFTNNGYGMNVKPALSKKETAALNAEIAKNRKGKKK